MTLHSQYSSCWSRLLSAVRQRCLSVIELTWTTRGNAGQSMSLVTASGAGGVRSSLKNCSRGPKCAAPPPSFARGLVEALADPLAPAALRPGRSSRSGIRERRIASGPCAPHSWDARRQPDRTPAAERRVRDVGERGGQPELGERPLAELAPPRLGAASKMRAKPASASRSFAASAPARMLRSAARTRVRQPPSGSAQFDEKLLFGAARARAQRERPRTASTSAAANAVRRRR